MIKQMAWNTFKNTGSIDSYLELVEVENIEKNIIEKQKLNTNELKSAIKIENNIKNNMN